MGEERDTEKNVAKMCDECMGPNLSYIAEKGESVCDDCGLVHEEQLGIAADNVNSLFGEHAHSQSVRMDKDINANIGTAGSRMYGGNSVTAATRRKMSYFQKIGQSSVSNPHPFAKRVKRNIDSLFGRQASHVLEFIVEMACRPLTSEQETIRNKQVKSMKKRLGMPKHSVCRKKGGVKGSSEEENAVIIAIAIRELAGKLGMFEDLDRRSLMAQFDITNQQIMNARKRIFDHWKARITMGWAAMPVRKSPNDQREDEIDQAMEYLFQSLSDTLSESDYLDVLYETSARLLLLQEGSGNALSINIESRMIVSVVAYASLNLFGLQSGCADTIADVFGLTSSGVRSRYYSLLEEVKTGVFQDNGAFDVSRSYKDSYLSKREPHALIGKFSLVKSCAKDLSSSDS
jgi:hypothetical protein